MHVIISEYIKIQIPEEFMKNESETIHSPYDGRRLDAFWMKALDRLVFIAGIHAQCSMHNNATQKFSV